MGSLRTVHNDEGEVNSRWKGLRLRATDGILSDEGSKGEV